MRGAADARAALKSAIVFGAALPALAALQACNDGTNVASGPPPAIAKIANACARFAPGSVIIQPPALFSAHGVLNVSLSYQETTDPEGRTLFCFMTPDGMEEPTLHVNPGDLLNITVTNNTPASPVREILDAPNCGDTAMTGSSVNVHLHGTNASPQCGADNVTRTLINSGSTFQYSVSIPSNEPPGLYWYHAHVHGAAEASVMGGAAGALVVDGIENVQPAVSGLRQRLLMIRDQATLAGLEGLGEASPPAPGGIPNHDLTVNYIPGNATTTPLTAAGVTTYTPSILHMQPGETQLWRICNCSSDSIVDLQLQFDGVPQPFKIAAIDGVPVNSQDGTEAGELVTATHYRIATAGRVEILANAPPATVKLAQLVTSYIDTGPAGDENPARPLFTVELSDADDDAAAPDDRLGAFRSLNTGQQMFGGLAGLSISTARTLYFTELADGSAFYMNVVGQPYALNTAFDPNNPPALVTTQGDVEIWTVQNRTSENHEFHLHQIHFQILSQDNFESNGSPQAPGIAGQFMDTVEIPYWACAGASAPCTLPYPQVQLLMDFRGTDVGEFVLHCHILGHEDLGMMAIMQVKGDADPADSAMSRITRKAQLCR